MKQKSKKVSKIRINLTALFDLVFVQFAWLAYVNLPTNQDKARLEMAKVIFGHIEKSGNLMTLGNSAFKNSLNYDFISKT